MSSASRTPRTARSNHCRSMSGGGRAQRPASPAVTVVRLAASPAQPFYFFTNPLRNARAARASISERRARARGEGLDCRRGVASARRSPLPLVQRSPLRASAAPKAPTGAGVQQGSSLSPCLRWPSTAGGGDGLRLALVADRHLVAPVLLAA